MSSECSFCTFTDKFRVVGEMSRVLRPGGSIGITDITVNGHLPEDVQSLLSWVACVAGPEIRTIIFPGWKQPDFPTSL